LCCCFCLCVFALVYAQLLLLMHCYLLSLTCCWSYSCLHVVAFACVCPWLLLPACGFSSFVATLYKMLLLDCGYSPPITTLVAILDFSKIPLVPLVIVILACPLLLFTYIPLDCIPSPCFCLL
jgi:hypothetical protein